jgi:hypothetical protein
MAAAGIFAAVGIFASGRAVAQVATTPATKTANGGGSAPPPSSSGSVSLASVAYADAWVPRTLVQVRRFFERGRAVAVREELIVAADGSPDPVFSLRFLAVEGEPAGSPTWTSWSQNYARYASLYQRHGSFRIRDLTRAAANYTLHDLGPSQRAGRSGRRMVVFPVRPDKSVWLLDVDLATQVVLYAGEYDVQLRLLSEVEALSFTPTANVTSPNVPSMVVTAVPNVDAARRLMPGAAFVDPSLQAVAEYALGRAQVVDNPLNGRRSLVLAYDDGVDEFFVVQSPGTSEYFAGLPSQNKAGGSTPHTMARTRDPLMASLLFWQSGVGFRVDGRASLRRLDDFAKQVFRQAIHGG